MNKITLKRITSKIGSGATPTGGKNAYLGGAYALIRSQNVQDMCFDYNGLAYINDNQAHKLDNVEVQPGDILFNITGDSICRCCIVPDDILPARVNQHVAIIRLQNVNSHYIMYFLQYLKPYLMSICNKGSSRNALTKDDLENLEVNIVENHEKIAILLDSINNKINTNNKIIVNLEKNIQTIYNYWFLQFDFPDENGRPYRLAGGKMVWNDELQREIPEGWKEQKLYNIANMDLISISPKSDCLYTYFSIPSFDKNLMPEYEKGENINSNKYKVPMNSVLVSKLNPSFQRIWMVGQTNDNAICSTEFLPFVSKFNHQPYLYSLLSSNVFQTFMINGSSSSTGSRKRIQPEICINFKFPYPANDRIITKYCTITNPLLNQRLNLINENQQLASLRDFLLPLLMNGQVTFKN